MNVNYKGKGKLFFINNTPVKFTINDEEYWFTMIEKGEPLDFDVDFVPQKELPFTLTKELKDEMYKKYRQL